ncbi:MAG TPA: anti-sigma factor [Thermoanaerobaculia bacterium]|nr:anti-sigma factor [Thermoanaerobaculia bacterium]
MDCETATPLIEALCDDELDVATAARLLAHLDACEPCSALRRDAETRNAALREARPDDQIPDAIRTRLARAVAKAPRARRTRRRGVLAGAAVLAAAGAIGAALLVRGAPPPVPTLVEASEVRELTGEVFCLRCALARLFPETPVLDPRHLPVLRTDDGEVVTLLDGAVTESVLARKGCAGRRVALTLRLFPRQELAEVLEARELGPASGPLPGEVVATAVRQSSSSPP